MAAESLPVQVACRVLGVSESGWYYEHCNRAPSKRSIRHAMLTDLISQIHVEPPTQRRIRRRQAFSQAAASRAPRRPTSSAVRPTLNTDEPKPAPAAPARL